MIKLVQREDIAQCIGYEAEPTPWHTVTQDQIDAFADCTLDYQFIHVDPDQAKQTPFGSTIAHGFLTLSLLSHFGEHFFVIVDGYHMGINAGFDKVRFLSPVKVNSRIRAVARVIDLEEKSPGQYRLVTEVTVEIDGEEKPALVAEWITIQMVD